MRDRHSCIRRQRHLEQVDAAAGRVLALQEFELQRANIDQFGHGVLACGSRATIADGVRRGESRWAGVSVSRRIRWGAQKLAGEDINRNGTIP
jgi:hypothetical protein